jgi:hypothetical protein
MKIESLHILSNLIRKEGFFEAVVSGINDWDDALDKRDDTFFDSAWTRNFNELKDFDYRDGDDAKLVSEVREFVFKKVYYLTNSSEVAGCISDDFGLVADAVCKYKVSGWVADLLDTYISGRFPY